MLESWVCARRNSFNNRSARRRSSPSCGNSLAEPPNSSSTSSAQPLTSLVRRTGCRQHVAGQLDVGGVLVAGVGAQLADALVAGRQHRLDRAPPFLEFAGDAAPLGLAVFVGALRIAEPGRHAVHDVDGLPDATASKWKRR
jgi:hypothetical protein